MPKVSELKTSSRIAAEELADLEIRREHERTALAHAVAMRVIGYRIDHGLSQTALARLLGMHQPAIARLEAGDHEPSLATLSRLAKVLGIEFHIDITPDVLQLRDTA
jgi:ribosome-binding protein aMBF1 (putative translation factor)